MIETGWIVHKFSPQSKDLIEEARLLLKANTHLVRLADFHVINPLDIIGAQKELSEALHASGLVRKIIEADIDFFRVLLGSDLHIQKFPYLRIARPSKAQDNIGMHRDTWYGSSPYEISVSIALENTDDAGALRVVSGSHAKTEAEYPTVERDSSHAKGSEGHKLGFLYAPKKLVDHIDSQPVPLQVGEALIFGSALVHGQEVNRSADTRFSVDVRLVNSFAPIQWERNVHADYYEVLTVSPVTAQARRYAA